MSGAEFDTRLLVSDIPHRLLAVPSLPSLAFLRCRRGRCAGRRKLGAARRDVCPCLSPRSRHAPASLEDGSACSSRRLSTATVLSDGAHKNIPCWAANGSPTSQKAREYTLCFLYSTLYLKVSLSSLEISRSGVSLRPQ